MGLTPTTCKTPMGKQRQSVLSTHSTTLWFLFQNSVYFFEGVLPCFLHADLPLRKVLLLLHTRQVIHLSCGLAMAQAKPIKLLVGFPPGGGTDAVARTLAEKLKDELGVPVVVEQQTGCRWTNCRANTQGFAC